MLSLPTISSFVFASVQCMKQQEWGWTQWTQSSLTCIQLLPFISYNCLVINGIILSINGVFLVLATGISGHNCSCLLIRKQTTISKSAGAEALHSFGTLGMSKR